MTTVPPAAEAVVAKIKRNAVRAGGVNGLRALSRALGVSVDDSRDTLPHGAMLEILERGAGVTLQPAEQRALWAWLDRDAEGTARPTDLLGALRHLASPLRRSLVARVVRSFEPDADGAVPVAEVLRRFDAGRHPQVLRREVPASEVRSHLAGCFDELTNPSGLVSAQELEQYFAGLAAVVDCDAHFAATLRGCWRLPGFEESATMELAMSDPVEGLSAWQTSGEKRDVLLDATLAKARDDTTAHHRSVLLQSPGGFRALGCALREADAAGTMMLPRHVFIEAVARVRLYFSHMPVLEAYDVNRDGTVDAAWYAAAVMGELPPARKLMSERAWRQLPKRRGAPGLVDVALLHRRMQATGVAELDAFLDAWDLGKAASAAAGGAAAAGPQEFMVEWLVPQSLRTPKDRDFEADLHRQWGVEC